MDWRIVFGLLVTIGWISAGLMYLMAIVGWNNFVLLPTADIGSFLEGAFAPLAFLWLVIGHFMQQKEINLAGPVKVLSEGEYPKRYAGVYHRPEESRKIFEERGWSEVAALQLRNPIHRPH